MAKAETKFTPGPWRVVSRANQVGIRGLWVDLVSGGAWCRKRSEVSSYTDTDLANARLIAAAPDLYAALKTLRAYLGPWAMDYGPGDPQAEALDAADAALSRVEQPQ